HTSMRKAAALPTRRSSDLYDVWRQVQAALRTSPDHAFARAGVLVAAGDVGALHRFVRDEIRLVSSSATRLRLGDEVRWGARAALDRKSTRLNSSHVKISYA